MALVGEAHIIVRAVTTQVEADIRKGFQGLDGVAGSAGKKAGNALTRGLTSGLSKNNAFSSLADQLRSLYPEAEKTAKHMTTLMRTGYTMQGLMGGLAGSIGTVVGGVGALGGAALGAAASVVSLGSALLSAMVGAKVAGMALKGVWAAASSLADGSGGGGSGGVDQQAQIDAALKALARTIENNQRNIVAGNNRIRDAQLALNEALKAGREEIQQLGFDAEEAALSEQRAAIDLDRAREALARTQDLPPNSRARKEAELAYQEAELNYRKSKDTASDLASEQDRLARQGVEGTEVVRDARAALAEAEADLAQTVIDAARDQADAEDALADAYRGVSSAAGGAASAFDKLTASQKVFAEYLAGVVIPKIRELREEIASKFLPTLQEQMSRVFETSFFDRLKAGFGSIAAAAGDAVKNFTDALVDARNADLFFNFLNQVSDLLPHFGTIFGNVWGSVLEILDAASGMTKRFVLFLESKTGAFRDFLATKEASGELDTFFTNVERAAGKIGSILGNLFGGIGDIVMANIGPGSGGEKLLTWLDDVSAGFANADPTFLNNYFNGAVDNFIAMGDAFSGVVSSIVKAGADPAVGEFWRILGSGATAFDTIVREAVKVAPSLAVVIKNITEIIAIMADSAQAKAFFDVLGFITGGLKSLLEVLKPVFDAIGPFIGLISAFGLAWGLLGKGMLVVVGYATQLAAGLGLVVPAAAAAGTGMTAAGTAGAAAGAAVSVAWGPVTLIVLAIAGVVAGLAAVMGIAEQNAEKASGEITKGFEKSASATDIFKSSLLAVVDGQPKENLMKLADTTGGLNKQLESASDNVGRIGRSMTNANPTFGALSQALGAVGRSLGDLAVKELPEAQLQFQKFADGQKLSTAAQTEALKQMPEYTKQLEEQASLMGIDLYNAQTGAIDQEKLLAFARGEGEVAIQRQTEALKTQTEEATKAINSAVESMQFKDGQLVESEKSYSDYLAEMKAKTIYNAAEIAAQNELLTLGVSATAIKQAADAGVSIQKMRDDVVAGGQNAIDAANSSTQEALGTYSDAVVQMQKDGLSELEKAAQQAYLNNEISLDEFISVTGTKLDNFNPSVDVLNDISAWNNLPATLRGLVPDTISSKINYTISGYGANVSGYLKFSNPNERKNGGIIPGFANGGIFAANGTVIGPGGPRDDRVSAMLSPGEYVVNALATKRYKPFLDAINNGSPTFANNSSTSSTGSIINNITVNPAPGMNEQDLAAAISREISFQMRKGAVA